MKTATASETGIKLPAAQTLWVRTLGEAREAMELWSDPVGLNDSRPFKDLMVTALDRVDQLMNLVRNSTALMSRLSELTTTLVLARELKDSFDLSTMTK